MDGAGDEGGWGEADAGDRAGDAAAERADHGDPTPESLARDYYRAIDEDDYDLLASLLAADFVHERPDRTLDGRERFVRFMREERPQTDTSHPIDGVYDPAGGRAEETDDETGAEVLVRGRLLAADGSEITAFVDAFRIADGALRSLRTYTH